MFFLTHGMLLFHSTIGYYQNPMYIFLYVLQDSGYKSNPPNQPDFFHISIFPKEISKPLQDSGYIYASDGHPIHLTNQDSMHMSHMKRDRFLSYWLCDTWTLKIKKEHDMHNQTSGIHQKWGFNSQQSKGKGQMLPFASRVVNDICILFIKREAGI